jgi:hypothetical protein
MSADDWGVVGTWVGSIGTIGAFVTAYFLALRELRKYREASDRAQASLVSAWLDVNEYGGQLRVRVLARNDSQSHVNDLMVSVADTLKPASDPYVTWIPGLNPTGEPVILITDVEVPDHLQRYRYELSFEFTDILNRRWRHARGEGLTLQDRVAPPIAYSSDGIPVGIAKGRGQPRVAVVVTKSESSPQDKVKAYVRRVLGQRDT